MYPTFLKFELVWPNEIDSTWQRRTKSNIKNWERFSRTTEQDGANINKVTVHVF